MPEYSGKFHYIDSAGTTITQGPCRLTFDEERCIVAPQMGQPLAFDLGDVDRAAPAEWDLQLTLYTSKVVVLKQFGPSFGKMCDELMEAWRNRAVKCLLLGDLEQVKRFTGSMSLNDAAPAACEIRLYESNIAVLPLNATPVQWRLADVDRYGFDPNSWAFTLESPQGRLVLSKLAKKTEEFREKFWATMDALRTHSASVLHDAFPFLGPDALQRLLAKMPEGRAVSLGALAEIDKKLPDALVAGGVDAGLKPYFDVLRSKAVPGTIMAGYKFIREDEEPEPDPEAEAAEAVVAEGAPAEPVEKPPLFFWFFFQMAANPKIVAWEASTGTGRATYFFRIGDGGSVEREVQTLARGLALVNFRREPVYLSDESLERQAKYHRYAIGCRKLLDLRSLRTAFAGRAIHSSLESWTAQVGGKVDDRR